MSQFPISTYRIQFNKKCTFLDALHIVEYLHRLGISHLYASPIFRANPGSLHGYDVLDHSQLNPELGSQEDFEALIRALKSTHMGMIVDIIPNHMYAVDSTNHWWGDVLENGPSSPYADFFDIDWNPPRRELINKVLLPLLEDQYGNVLESKTLKVVYREGGFFVELPGIVLPTDPKSWTLILEPVQQEIQNLFDENDPELLEMQSIITAVMHLPLTSDMDKEKIQERRREKEVIKHRLDELIKRNSSIKKAVAESLITLNGVQENPHSFDRLEAFLEIQSYRLCFWRVANDEINYRRFFDVISLVGICTEKQEVFEAVHNLLFQMAKNEQIDGVRVDHIDGLRNPEKYFRDLQVHLSKTGIVSDNKEDLFYVIGEKILIEKEKVHLDWLLHGTTGYDFLNQLNGLFIVQENKKAFLDLYYNFTDNRLKISDHVYFSKKLVLQSSMASELHILSRKLDRISQQHRSSRDFTIESLKAALLDTIVFFPVYRSYIDTDSQIIHKEDREYIYTAINRAKKANPATNGSIFDFIQNVLLLEHPSGLTREQIIEREDFVMRFQQLTGPVMAKGVEDTTFYRCVPLVSLNEVGADFFAFGTSIEIFHERNQERQESWRYTLLATSTHDTKRSEDVRARINVLSEIPDEWCRVVHRWQEMNYPCKGRDGDDYIPDANEEYLFYQTLVGTWPLHPMDSSQHIHYMNRMYTYMDKALKEAKMNTSWINPNAAYDQKVKQFVYKVLQPDLGVNQFLTDFKEFTLKIALAGMLNSLSQTLIKMTSPGVPDIYQGNEIWDFSLVDPDNRREVDFENRIYLQEAVLDGMKKQPREFLEQMRACPEDGRIKLFIIMKTAQLRMKEQELFSQGTYIPLMAKGPNENHIICYAWIHKSKVIVVISSRFFMSFIKNNTIILDANIWKETGIVVPKEISSRTFREIFTQDEVQVAAESGVIQLDAVLTIMPFAILEAIDA